MVNSKNLTFGKCLSLWLEKKSLEIRPNTLLSYHVTANSSIMPALGNIDVSELTRQQVQEYFVSLKKRGITVNTMRKHMVIIRGTLEDALIDGIVSSNVADHVKLPRKEKFEGCALSEADARNLMLCIEKESEPIRSAVTLALIYGLRRSEICGLRWKDIDFSDKTIQICNTYTEYGGKKFEMERTKSRASRRTLFLIDRTIEYFQSLQYQQLLKGFELDKVCRHSDGSTVQPEYLTRAVKAFLIKCGYENIRLHDLRHTAASLLARRLPIKNVQIFLGHEDVSTTLNIYAHITDADRIITAQTMNAILLSVPQ